MVTLVCFAGVAIYALAQLLHVIVGWSLLMGALASASIVLIYVLLGGFRATIFTSVFQLLVMIVGLAPLLLLTVHFTAASFVLRPDRWHLWKPLSLISPHATLDRIGVTLGLGFVISFSYWCTDFVMIQRALTARTIDAARRVPLLAGFGKLAIALLVVLPGAAAPALLGRTGIASFDETMPRLMSYAFGPALLALGTAALLASLMAGLAGNVSGFSALWTEEIYRNCLQPQRSEQHYIRVGRLAVVACFLFAQAGAYATLHFHDLMEFLQLISALFYAPVFAAVLAGFVSRRTTEKGAFAGITMGVFLAFSLQVGVWTECFHFGSQMSANFYAAILSFSISMLCCLFYGREKKGETGMRRQSFELDADTLAAIRPTRELAAVSLLLLALCLLLNLLWW
jgi:SSS family solute:Na+ symporter